MGGSSAALCYLLTYLDRRRFDPVVAYYFLNSGSHTKQIRQLGIPVVFLSSKRSGPPHFLSSRPSPSALHWLRTPLRFFLRAMLFDLPQLCKLLRLLRREAVELIVLNNDVHYHLPAALAARLARIPCICRKAGGLGEGHRIKRLLTPCVDLFIAISTVTARDQRDHNPSTKRLVLLHPCVDLKRFIPVPPRLDLRLELGVPPGWKIVASVGRFHPGKGQRELIEAASLIVQKYRNVSFLIVGDEVPAPGGVKSSLEYRVQQLGLSRNVIFTGWREDMDDLLRIMDVFVHCPTTFVEALGIANLEAMAMAKPIVVSNNGGLPDAIIDNVTGLIVQPADINALAQAILSLLQDDALAQRLGRNARDRVATHFNAEQIAHRFHALFDELLRTSAEPRRRSPSPDQPAIEG